MLYSCFSSYDFPMVLSNKGRRKSMVINASTIITKESRKTIDKSEADKFVLVVVVEVSNPVTEVIPNPIKDNKTTTTPIGINETTVISSK